MAAAIGVEQTSLSWLAQADRHIERPDRQILLLPVAGSPTNHTTAMKVENDGKVEPAFRRLACRARLLVHCRQLQRRPQ